MDFQIKKNSILPSLVLTVSDDDIFKKKLENCTITFSMIDIETGKYFIANKSGGVYFKDKIIKTTSDDKDSYIYFNWNKMNTSKAGVYKGEFKIDFFNEGESDSCENIIFPIKEDLYIYVIDSIVKTSINGF